MPYIIYTELECLVKRIEGCANKPQLLPDIPCQQFGYFTI